MKHILSILAFFFVSFGVQGLYHFKVNASYYQSIDFVRKTPILPMGFAAMIIQAAIISWALSHYRPGAVHIKDGLVISGLFGGFLAAYVALAEPAKYAAPSVYKWIMVELPASAIQFLLFGLAIGYIHQRFTRGL